MNILVTGGAGFIGSHLIENLLKDSHTVVSIDNFNDYYDPLIKKENISLNKKPSNSNFYSVSGDIRDKETLDSLFKTYKIDTVIHLAAMAGVRFSILNPELYFDVNINGTLNILECCKSYNVKKLLFASSSSVYGNNDSVPFKESDPVDHPISPYAATKKSGELMCYNYHHLYNIPTACIRFFTVYGPRQRPEMAIHKFTGLIDSGEEIPVFNQGHCLRDYTYVDDIVQGIVKLLNADLTYDVVNLGESKTISTLDLIRLIEDSLGKKAQLNLMPAQEGDVEKTFADISKAISLYDYKPTTTIQEGIVKFMEWYKEKNYSNTL